MKNREKATLPQSNAHPEAQDTPQPGQDTERNQGTQLQTQKADAEALKAYLKYRAEHPEKHIAMDEMPHRPSNIDMREYSKK